MISCKRIAKILTTKWLQDGILPINDNDGVEYNYIWGPESSINDWDVRYAHTSCIAEQDQPPQYPYRTYIHARGSIDKYYALREAWPYLTGAEKIEIMAEILGSH